MPKPFEYFGLVVLFYANEHEPVHVHGKCQGREARATLSIADGRVTDIAFGPAKGRSPLSGHELRLFQELVRHRADQIVQLWIDFFVLHKSIKPERITQRLK